MKTFRSLTIPALIAFAVMSTVQARSDGQGGDKPCPEGGRRGPPPQALEACASSAENARCSFIGRNEQMLNGQCLQVRDGLACVPDDAPRPPRGGADAERRSDRGGEPPEGN